MPEYDVREIEQLVDGKLPWPRVQEIMKDAKDTERFLKWLDILQRAKLVQHHQISREHLSVREHMSIILRSLQGRRFALFEELFDVGRGAPVVVVTFIALLELAREHLLEVTQAEAFAPIYVRLAYQSA